jgi:hypothetical protein
MLSLLAPSRALQKDWGITRTLLRGTFIIFPRSVHCYNFFVSDLVQTLLKKNIRGIGKLQAFQCNLLLILLLRSASLFKWLYIFDRQFVFAIVQIWQLWLNLAEECFRQALEILARGHFNLSSFYTFLQLLNYLRGYWVICSLFLHFL